MRAAPAPRLHLFVCANRREGSPLGPGCGEHGDALYDALKREVGARGEVAVTWVTKTACLGICPRRGATVARYPAAGPLGSAIVTEVEPSDAAALLAGAATGSDAAAPPPPSGEPSRADPARDALQDLRRELDALEELQRKKVLDLARRLKPGLTLEDVQNPHDFPELDDPDWHYADGVLAGIASVRSALAALERGNRSE